MSAATIRVECAAGHRGEPEPRCLYFGARAVPVSEILDRWLDPGHRNFKLRGDDNAVYLVRHHIPEDRWDLTLFDSGDLDAIRLAST